MRDAGSVLVSEETGAELGAVVGGVVNDGVDAARGLEQLLENKVRERLSIWRGHALFLAVVIMALPAAAATWAVSRLTVRVTLPQRLVLTHIVNSAIAVGLLFVNIVWDVDGAALLRHKSGISYLAFCLALIFQAGVVFYIAFRMAALYPAHSRQRRTYQVHALIYALLALHVIFVGHRNILATAQRIAAGGGIFGFANVLSYMVYFTGSLMLLLQVNSVAREGEKPDGLASQVRTLFLFFYRFVPIVLGYEVSLQDSASGPVQGAPKDEEKATLLSP